MAWKTLIARMRLGVKTWGKYVAEYQLQWVHIVESQTSFILHPFLHCVITLNFSFWFSFPPPIPINYKPLLFILLSNWKVGGLCNRYRGSYPFSMLFTFHYLAFVSHDSFLYLSAVVTCDNSSSSIFQTTTTYTLRQEWCRTAFHLEV